MWICKHCGSESFKIDENNPFNFKTKYVCLSCEDKSSELEDIADWIDDDMLEGEDYGQRIKSSI